MDVLMQMRMAAEPLCPFRGCPWEARNPAEMCDHLGQFHRLELQAMLAGIDGGRGEPVTVGLVQYVSAQYVADTPDLDLVAATLVPKMRAELAASMAKKGLRPLDPWPAVVVARWCYATVDAAISGDPQTPGALRPARPGEQANLYSLELSTDAVTDTRKVELT